MTDSSSGSSTPDQDSPSSACLDQSVLSQHLAKTLPEPPNRFHYFRHSLLSLWYRRFKRLEGYHFGVLCCAAVAATVLIINLILAIWAVSTHKMQNGLGTLQDGSCKKTATLTFWTHLAINILSTLLLGASNYSMQCLSSPTRNEIDKAHSRGIWLDIGVPSLRNLRWISKSRLVLWWLLAISSIPLHLLYNSAVFSNLSVRSSTVFVVSSEFLQGAPFKMLEQSQRVDLDGQTENRDIQGFLLGYQYNQSSLQRLENKACLETYTAPLISANSDLILITNVSNFTNSLLYYAVALPRVVTTDDTSDYFFNPSSIVMPQSWSLDIDALPGIWKLVVSNELLIGAERGYVQYCLSKPEEEHCRLQFSLGIVIVVIICNAIKATCMGIIAWKQDAEPLVTLGDALASFLGRYDVTTRGHCITGKAWFENKTSWSRYPSRWEPDTVHWFRAATPRRWFVCNAL